MSYPPPIGPPAYGSPHGYPWPGPPGPQRKRAIWPWIVLGAVLLLCGGPGLIGGFIPRDSSQSTSGSHDAAPVSAHSAEAGALEDGIAPAGSQVRDGQFAFVVTGVEPAVASVGSGFSEVRARGEFVLIRVNVTNAGREPRSYYDDNQKLLDNQGREFASDSSAGRRVNDDVDGTLNPGFTISVAVVFDVPPGTTPFAVELHDSMWSNGVKVALG